LKLQPFKLPKKKIYSLRKLFFNIEGDPLSVAQISIDLPRATLNIFNDMHPIPARNAHKQNCIQIPGGDPLSVAPIQFDLPRAAHALSMKHKQITARNAHNPIDRFVRCVL
ncbi:hypothetical protein WBG78_30380, partial [Chryseolinea sp. T2]|uniref:hypothetical protein n=1 Tax=Chryseolinea sp. T2 TaxID=3129255 RepID=UPI0030780EB1